MDYGQGLKNLLASEEVKNAKGEYLLRCGIAWLFNYIILLFKLDHFFKPMISSYSSQLAIPEFTGK